MVTGCVLVNQAAGNFIHESFLKVSFSLSSCVRNQQSSEMWQHGFLATRRSRFESQPGSFSGALTGLTGLYGPEMDEPACRPEALAPCDPVTLHDADDG